MRIFKLKNITYKNIMAVGDTPISIKLDAHQKTLITGGNGGGKSTLLEAITFGLFGRPFRDIKKGQMINSVTKKNMWVQIELEDNNKSYVITRGQKPNIFEVTCNGIALDESASAADFQLQFEDMIGMSYNSFKQIVVLGTAGYTPFMSLKAADRRKLVEDLLEVSILAEMDKLNKSIITKQLNPAIQEVELKLTHNNTQLKTLQDVEERQKKLSSDNIGRFQSMLDEKIGELDALKASTKTHQDAIDAVEFPDDVSEESRVVHGNIVRIEGEVNSATRVITLYSRGGSCPTCLQKLEQSDLINDINANKAAYEVEMAELKQKHAALQEQKLALSKANDLIRTHKYAIENNRTLGANIVQQIQKIKAAIAEASKEQVDCSVEINALKAEYTKLVEKRSDLIIEKHRRSVVTELLKDSGIKGTLVKKYLPLFNRQINHYLNLLDSDYSFELDEEFNETIKSRGRESFSYASFSQGEKGRIDLSLMFTWRSIAEIISGVRISCLFLDEVFDSAIDQSCADSIFNLLSSMVDSNIFVISHRQHDPENYDQHLQMRKVGRFTVME